MGGRRSIVLGLHDDAAFRTNVGFVNRGASPVTLTTSLLGESGVVTSVPVTIPARGSIQPQVQQHHAEGHVAALVHGTLHGGGLIDRHLRADLAQQRAQGFAEQRVVVDQEHGHR